MLIVSLQLQNFALETLRNWLDPCPPPRGFIATGTGVCAVLWCCAMAPCAQLVIGPAGSGKSTYCYNIYNHCQTIGRTVHIINLDPAADEFAYPVAADIRELISLADVMEEMNLGPNGALLYCMEYLEDSLDDWLAGALEGFGEDDCILFDCPGQIELYSHHSAFRTFVDQMQQWGWRLVAVYMLDSQFITDAAKLIAGCMQCQAAMMNLELPHVNVFSKVDLLEDKSQLEPYLIPDHQTLVGELHDRMRPKYKKLNTQIAQLLDDYSMVSFHPLDISDEDSLAFILYTVDSAVQYGEGTYFPFPNPTTVYRTSLTI
jgi:GTPase SAR1 family protein